MLYQPAEVDQGKGQPVNRPVPVYWMPGMHAPYAVSPTHNLEWSAWVCINDFLRLANQLRTPTDLGLEELHKWCCSLKNAFQDFLAQHGGTDCTLYDLLNSFRCPDTGPHGQDAEKYRLAIADQIGELTGTLDQYINQCLCSAVLSPVPSPMLDNCVPLATVTLQRKDCHIIRVCNTDVRKFALTFANLSYWLSPFEPFLRQFHQTLDQLCCSGERETRPVPINFRPLEEVRPGYAAEFKDRPDNEAARMIERFVNAWQKQSEHPDSRALVLEALRLTKEGGTRYMNDIERENPIQSVLLDKLVVPFMASIGAGVGRQAGVSVSTGAGDLSTLEKRLDDLTATVQAQQDTISAQQKLIDELRNQPGNQ
jgi:hypothetical protein